MLESIREGSQGIVSKVIIGLIILSFAFAGVSGYFGGNTQTAAATVNGVEISQSDLERAYQNQRARMEGQYGESFGRLLSDSQYLATFRAGILEQLIGDELVSQFAQNSGVRVSDTQIKEAILSMQEFQVDGEFNNDRYVALLGQAGYTPTGFRDYLRIQLSRQQVVSAIAASDFALSAEAKQAMNLQQQTRDIKYLTIEASAFEDTVAVTDEAKQAYYESHLDDYLTKEQVKVSYVELKLSNLIEKQVAEESAIQAYYDNNLATYQTEPQVRASHILVDFGDDSEAAKAKADELLLKLQQGADFAELAKAESSDSFSAEMGGDLDWFGKGVMDPAFEEAAFGLSEVNELSSVVQSSFGYHIIKLTGLKPVVTRPLEEVRGEIEIAIKTEAATTEFFELQTQMAALAFEVPDELVELSEALNTEIKTTALFSRDSAPELFRNQSALEAAFASELIEEAVNSEVIQINDEHALVLRVEEHQAVRTLSLEEVDSRVTSALTASLAFEMAQTWINDLQVKLIAGENVDEVIAEKSAEWKTIDGMTRFANDVTADVRDIAFQSGVLSYDVSNAGERSVSVVQVLKVNQPDLSDEASVEAMRQRMGNASSQRSMQAFIDLLKEKADIQRF